MSQKQARTGTSSLEEVRPFESVYPDEEITHLVKCSEIPRDKKDAFRNVLSEVHYSLEFFRLANRKFSKPAPRDDARDLYKALTKASGLLKRRDMVPRLSDANKRLYLPSDGGGMYQPTHYLNFRKTLEAFLPVAKAAIDLDGRQVEARRRERKDLRSAAHQLHKFWVGDLGRDTTVQSYGGRQTSALSFLLDCLVIAVPKIKEASFRGFESLDKEPAAEDAWINALNLRSRLASRSRRTSR